MAGSRIYYENNVAIDFDEVLSVAGGFVKLRNADTTEYIGSDAAVDEFVRQWREYVNTKQEDAQ